MDTLEQLRRQFDTAGDLGGIVRTMKALAAVSIRQYEAAVRSLADYTLTVELGLHVVLRDLPPLQVPAVRRGVRIVRAVVFGSDHGLCGRFNEDIVAHVNEVLANDSANTDLRVLAIGARAGALLKHDGQPVEATLSGPASAMAITTTVRQVLLHIDAWQQQDPADSVLLFHQRPTAGERHRPAGARLLPVSLARFQRLEAQHWTGRTLPTFSMERNLLFSMLLRQYLFVSVFRACAESQAAENASRLAAMQAAEKNLSERQSELLSAIRRLRQNAITSELLDVVAGYEVLRGRSLA